MLLAAGNLGGYADTTGTVTGLEAGRIWGHQGIPENWRGILWEHDSILTIADDLCAVQPIDQ